MVSVAADRARWAACVGGVSAGGGPCASASDASGARVRQVASVPSAAVLSDCVNSCDCVGGPECALDCLECGRNCLENIEKRFADRCAILLVGLHRLTGH